MILQKFATAIRRQDWFQVIVEVLIVIVGIFLGLQVQAWYDGRSAQAEEQRVTSIFVTDLEKTIRSYDILMDIMIRQNKSTEHVIKTLEIGVLEPVDVAEFEEGIFRYGRQSAIDANISSFHDGNLNRILNNDLRLFIDEYISFINRRKVVYQNIGTRIEQARSLTTLRASVRVTMSGERKSYYIFDELKEDGEFRAAVSNISSMEVLAYTVIENLKINSELMLEVLLKYQADGSIGDANFRIAAPLQSPIL